MFPIALCCTLLVLVEARSVGDDPPGADVATAIENSQQLTRIELDSAARDTVAGMTCSDAICNQKETMIAYFKCCEEEDTDTLNPLVTPERCCRVIKFWFFPVTIAGVGFSLGALFAMCFQCR